tara:strand:+ start:124 stop:573 length:450 start_codon:yes stop_codon:yes gene_type:complete
MQLKKVIYILTSLIFLTNVTCAQEKFLSLKKNKVNVRYGPGFDYPVKYIYKKLNLPVKLIDKKENWRRIIDQKNNSGWIHRRMLKNTNSVIILEDKILFKKSSNFSRPIINLQKGRLLIVKNCEKKWCNVETDNFSGWIMIKNVWGKVD